MARSGDTYTVPAGALTWAAPAPGDSLSISGWNALLADIVAALSQSLRRDGGGTMSGQFKAVSGNSGTPGISFASDTSCGIYRGAAGVLRISISGNDIATFNSGGVQVLSAPGIFVNVQPQFGYVLRRLESATLSGTTVLQNLTAILNSSGDVTINDTTGVVTVARGGTFHVRVQARLVNPVGSGTVQLDIRKNGAAYVASTPAIVGMGTTTGYNAAATLQHELFIPCSAGDTLDATLNVGGTSVGLDRGLFHVQRVL